MVDNLVLKCFGRPQLGHAIKTNFITFQTVDPEMRSIFEILGNMSIVIMCCSVCGEINFETDISFLIKPFSNMIKKSGRKFKYLQNKKIKELFKELLLKEIKKHFLGSESPTLIPCNSDINCVFLAKLNCFIKVLNCNF